jgi:hypothetical protein
VFDYEGESVHYLKGYFTRWGEDGVDFFRELFLISWNVVRTDFKKSLMNSKDKGDAGEKFVNSMAFSAFLKHWCFPNPRDITKDNKEICDLLIVFDDTCIIVSVKNYQFSGNYDKYFRRTVDKAVRQISGAERKLFGDRVILLQHPDRPAEPFPKEKIRYTFRIIVNTNTQVKYYQTSFYINEQDRVTIVDAHAWETLLSEMNTINDFCRYLRERERLFGNRPAIMLPRDEYDLQDSDEKQLTIEVDRLQKENERLAIISGSEKDLIALYIVNIYQFPDKLYNATEPYLYVRADGMWDRLQKTKFTTKRDEFESEGYLIDHLVRDLLIQVPDGEKISMALYRLDRLQRAEFVKEFYRFHDEQRNRQPSPQLHRTNLIFDDTHFVFIYFDLIPHDDDELLEGFIDKSLHHHDYLMNYSCKEVIAIAFSKDMASFACGYISKDDPLSDEERKHLEEAFKALNWKLRD